MSIFSFLSGKSEEFSQLEEKLKLCRDIKLSDEKQARMKSFIMSSLKEKKTEEEAFGFSRLISKIKEVSSTLTPDAMFRANLKEKLLTLAEFGRMKRSFNFFGWMKGTRKLGAAIVVALFVFVTVFNFTFNIEKVDASYLTLLEEVSGDVYVIRDGNEILGTSQLLLRADDVIKTGPGSKAVIRFLDQSISRLDENTEIKISKLFVNPYNKTETAVEVILTEGRVWARVVNLIDNISSFQVKSKNTVAVAKKRAAFDMVSSKGKSTVSAIQNRVDLVVATDKKVIETTLVKGFTAEVKSDAQTLTPKITSDEQVEAKNEWVTQNLEQDKQYIATVKQEAKDQMSQQANILPGSPLYAVRELTQNTKLALTMDDFTKQQMKLEKAKEKFAAAEMFFESGDKEKAQALLGEFKWQIDELIGWSNEFEFENPAKALELRAQIKETVDNYQKQLTLTLPAEPLYDAKSVVGEVQLVVAQSVSQKTEKKIEQAGEKLLEAHDMIENGDKANAQKQIENYKQATVDVITEIKSLPVDEKQKAVSALLDNKKEDLKVLEAMSSDAQVEEKKAQEAEKDSLQGETQTVDSGELLLPDSEMQELEDTQYGEFFTTPTVDNNLGQTLETVKQDTLTQLGEAVWGVQQDQSSTEVLEKVQDITNLDVNGKPLVDMTVTKNQVMIKSEGTVIKVSPDKTMIPSVGTPQTSQTSTTDTQTNITTTTTPTKVPTVSPMIPGVSILEKPLPLPLAPILKPLLVPITTTPTSGSRLPVLLPVQK
ncbi:MAG: DUF5667 domain-containing protein [Candidatus Gracilibacteria bacterium]